MSSPESREAVTSRPTSDEIELAIAAAIEDRNMPAVIALIRRLALVNPDRAEIVMALIQDYGDIARERLAQ